MKKKAPLSRTGGALLSYLRCDARLALERLGPRDRPEDQQEEHGADERDQDAAEVEAAHVPTEQRPAHEPAQQRTDDADDDVAQNAEATATHHHAGEPACDQTNQQPRNNAHDELPSG